MNLAIIPARAGSKRIPRKNIRLFGGRPMIAWPVAAALASGLFDHVLVSTDDEEIAEIASAAGAEAPFRRPAELADDQAGTLEVIAHATAWARAQGWAPEAVCCLYATAPFVLPTDLEAARQLHREGRWDYVFAAGRYDDPVQRAFVRADDGAMALLFPEHRLTRSQDLPPVFHDAGQFYWGSAPAWLDRKPIFGPRTTFVELPRDRVQDIDTPEDWTMAELLFERMRRATNDD